MAGRLVLVGTFGIVKDKKYYVERGKTVIIGRSSSCDICLHGMQTEDQNQENTAKHFQTISRRHLKITVHSEKEIELEDLSANGTALDGENIEKVFISDIEFEKHVLLLGSKEKFLLEWEEKS